MKYFPSPPRGFKLGGEDTVVKDLFNGTMVLGQPNPEAAAPAFVMSMMIFDASGECAAVGLSQTDLDELIGALVHVSLCGRKRKW